MDVTNAESVSIILSELQPSSRSNRRGYTRYRCAPATVGKVFHAQEEECILACVFDLSLGGVGFSVKLPLHRGQPITLEISSPQSVLEKHELKGTIVHSTRQASGDWLVGCRFDQPISDDLLDRLL